ncbi:hypothetical protein JXC34_03665 [Candidatus Woesearchaeota archaeon]|nr:hypothetical protein [Candidatus Woesearchaeota archaeon]
MTEPTWISKTTLPDMEGNQTEVHKGDLVKLIDNGSIVDHVDQDEKYFAEKNRAYQLKQLGEGPYKISDMGVWPCGNVMIYVETETSPGSGVYASDLVYCGENSG